MPTYEYRCKKCEHTWEEFQSIKAKPSRKCPDCGELKAERMISAGAGIIFKGSGFYQTDYRSESWKKGEKADKTSQETASSTDSGSKAGSKADSKTDSKSNGSKSGGTKSDSTSS